MRVHELAQALALSSREVIDLLRADGEWVTSHLSVVPQPVASRYLAPTPPRGTKTPTRAPPALRRQWERDAARAPSVPLDQMPRLRRRPGPRQRRHHVRHEDDYDLPLRRRYWPDQLTTRDVAEAFDVTLATVRQWVARGYLSPVDKWGTSNVFRTSDALDAYDEVMSRRRATALPRRQVGWLSVEPRPIDIIPAQYWDSVITVDEAAKLIRVSASTIRSWIHRGHLTPLASSQPRAVRLRVVDVMRAAHNRHLPRRKPRRPRPSHPTS